METPTVNFIQAMREQIEKMLDEGNLAEALKTANEAVDKCRKSLTVGEEADESLAAALELRSSVYLAQQNYNEVISDANKAIENLRERPEKFSDLGRLYALIGAAYDAQGRTERVIDAWKKAVTYFEKCEPPLLLDVATMTNNLGFIAKAGGDLDSAEDFFLRALKILHSEVGEKHAQTASVSNNLGAVYLAAGYLDQAREMHMMALETRRSIFGESHPDTAQSHNNLALAYLKTGDRSWARKHFEKALEGFESLGIEYSSDLEAVASNYCDFLIEEGEGILSGIIAHRVKELLSAEQPVGAS
ncbi:tetratricopeptide repeat protein [Luteolibacter algae]|uniref:Tetratricopeptide repeat protein n=1 Tax=Luteolibacter algae TaxID=454151 RepID=A0ABW5DAY5_9BACT